MEKHLNRIVKHKELVSVPGTFKSMWAAETWLHQNGYSSGSTGRGNDPVALRIGEYDLPQKWHNFYAAGKKSVDGVMYCQREGDAIIYIFNLSPQLESITKTNQ